MEIFKKIIYFFFLISSCKTSKLLESEFTLNKNISRKYISEDGRKCITLIDSFFYLSFQRTQNTVGFNIFICDTSAKCIIKQIDNNVFVLKRIEKLYDIQFEKTFIYDKTNNNEVKIILKLPKMDSLILNPSNFIVSINDKFVESKNVVFSFLRNNFYAFRKNSLNVMINQDRLDWVYYGKRYFGRTSFDFCDSFSITRMPSEIVYELKNFSACFSQQLDFEGFFLYKKDDSLFFLGEKFIKLKE